MPPEIEYLLRKWIAAQPDPKPTLEEALSRLQALAPDLWGSSCGGEPPLASAS